MKNVRMLNILGWASFIGSLTKFSMYGYERIILSHPGDVALFTGDGALAMVGLVAIVSARCFAELAVNKNPDRASN
jgi:hypothetical protein